jgi:hypothetical protein
MHTTTTVATFEHREHVSRCSEPDKSFSIRGARGAAGSGVEGSQWQASGQQANQPSSRAPKPRRDR